MSASLTHPHGGTDDLTYVVRYLSLTCPSLLSTTTALGVLSIETIELLFLTAASRRSEANAHFQSHRNSYEYRVDKNWNAQNMGLRPQAGPVGLTLPENIGDLNATVTSLDLTNCNLTGTVALMCLSLCLSLSFSLSMSLCLSSAFL